MKIRFLLPLFLFCTSTLYSQHNNAIIKGSIADSAANVKLQNASVSILQAKDSFLLKFTSVNQYGNFQINNLENGNYILLVEYPKYADFIQKFTIDSNQQTVDFGIISLQLKAQLLREIIVRNQVGLVRIKGDTTEYNVRNLITQPNAKVEDLLKQLPAFEVDQNGKITVYGQQVTKVLVNGEEFFSDDPTLVTRNIRADMVDKIQLFDKKSDQAAFTGVDDGKRTKTVNVILKEDKNTGTFGNMDGGIATDRYFQNQGIYNNFSKKRKYSFYGTAANTGKVGLGQSQENRLGAENNVSIGEGGITYVTGGADELNTFNGRYSREGKPLAKTGGAHYDNKWDGDKQSININYRIGSLQVKGLKTVIIQQNLSEGIILTNSDEQFDNYAFRQKLDGTYKLKINPTTNFQIGGVAILKNFDVINTYKSSTQKDGKLLNTNGRSLLSAGSQKLITGNALFTKKFKREGNSFSWNMTGSYDNTQVENRLISDINYYSPRNQVDSNQLIQQFKNNKLNGLLLNSNMTYSEALSKSTAVIFNYRWGLYNNIADKKTYDFSTRGIYDSLNYDFSSEYKFIQLANQFGAILYIKAKKSNMNLGTRVALMTFRQTNVLSRIEMNRNFTFWSPQLNYTNNISQQQSISLQYNGSASQPTIEQIQPVKVNNDPLNVLLGNPNLTPAYTHQINVSYKKFANAKGKSLTFDGGLFLITNPINTSITTDVATGKSLIQHINVNRKNSYNYNAGVNFNKSFTELNLSIYNRLYTTGNTYYNYVNSALNKLVSRVYADQFILQKLKQKKYTLNFSFSPTYSINKSSLQPEYDNNAFGYYTTAYALFYLGKKFQFSSNLVYIYTGKTKAFASQKQTLLYATFSKTFLKKDNLKASIQANDLLNQNLYVVREVAGNTIFQSRNNGIGRYIMLSITWDFTRFKTISVKE